MRARRLLAVGRDRPRGRRRPGGRRAGLATAGSRAAAQTPARRPPAAAMAVTQCRPSGCSSWRADLSQPLGVTAPPGDTHRLFVVEKTGNIA